MYVFKATFFLKFWLVLSPDRMNIILQDTSVCIVFSSTAAEGRRGDNFLWLCFLIESSPISLWSIWSQAPTILYFHLCARVQNCSSTCLCPTEMTKSSMLMLQKPRNLDWFYGGHIGGLCVVGVCRRTRGLQEWKPCRCHPFASRYENEYLFLFVLCPKLCSTSWVWWRRVWVLVFFFLTLGFPPIAETNISLLVFLFWNWIQM